MTEEKHNDQALFEAARRIDSREARGAYLRQSCGEDIAQAERVAALLRAFEENASFLESPAVNFGLAPTFTPPVGEKPDTQIGPYKLLQVIGEGGMGVVYMAEQSEPVKRKVALKLIKPGMDSRQVIARFEAERQALSMMDHVNIARVLDAGTTPPEAGGINPGRPYFVMELIHGVPITKYCDDNHLTPRQRLELFVPVCQAIQHAHQKGIIHRDIKPSNVMVTLYDGKPVPKVIDFGVAKATEQRLTERSLFTQHGTMIGTLEYMSPEQAEMSSAGVDTRSDIYSMGVLLYELLTGSTPLSRQQIRDAAFAEILRLIREEEPPRPSVRLSDSGEALPSISALRQMEPSGLTRLLRGELDWIVMKSLEKDRDRRYESAGEFGGDVYRYLNGEAVLAAPPSAIYRFRKFVRRNRGAVLTSLAVVCSLVLGIIGTTIAWREQARLRIEAERQEREADKLAGVAEAVSQFQNDMLRSSSPYQSGDKVTVLEVMMAAIKDLDAGKLKHQPLVEANVRATIGSTLHELGRYSEAEPEHRKALNLRRSTLTTPHWGIAQSLRNLARTLEESGKLPEAESLYREALTMQRLILAPDHPELTSSLAGLGGLLQVTGEYLEAETLCREALDIERKRRPVNQLSLAERLGSLGWLLQVLDKFAESEALCREAIELRRRNLPPDHPDIAESLNHLAVVLARSKRLAEAEPLFREMLAIDRKSLPARHPRIGQDLNNLATALQEQGKLAESEPLQREGLEFRRQTLPTGHPYIAQSLKNLAVLLSEQGRFAEAEPLAREALEIRRAALPEGHKDIAGSLLNLGTLLKNLGRFPDGEAALLEAERIFKTTPGLPQTLHDECVEALVQLYVAWNDAEPGNGHDAAAERWKGGLADPRL